MIWNRVSIPKESRFRFYNVNWSKVFKFLGFQFLGINRPRDFKVRRQGQISDYLLFQFIDFPATDLINN